MSALTDIMTSAVWTASTLTWAWALCFTMLAVALGAFGLRYGAALEPSSFICPWLQWLGIWKGNVWSSWTSTWVAHSH